MTGDALTTSPLHINERILHYLTGAASMDERLRCLTEAVAPAAVLLPSYSSLAERITAHWPNGNGQLPWPVVQLFGAERSGKRAVAAAVSAGLGFRLRAISAAAAPRATAELDLFIRLWEREAALNPTVLLLECDELEPPDSAGESAVNRLLETMRSPVLVSVRFRWRRDRLALSAGPGAELGVTSVTAISQTVRSSRDILVALGAEGELSLRIKGPAWTYLRAGAFGVIDGPRYDIEGVPVLDTSRLQVSMSAGLGVRFP